MKRRQVKMFAAFHILEILLSVPYNEETIIEGILEEQIRKRYP